MSSRTLLIASLCLGCATTLPPARQVSADLPLHSLGAIGSAHVVWCEGTTPGEADEAMAAALQARLPGDPQSRTKITYAQARNICASLGGGGETGRSPLPKVIHALAEQSGTPSVLLPVVFNERPCSDSDRFFAPRFEAAAPSYSRCTELESRSTSALFVFTKGGTLAWQAQQTALGDDARNFPPVLDKLIAQIPAELFGQLPNQATAKGPIP